MRPAWSVVLFTTLAGAAQGLLLALVLAQWAGGPSGTSSAAALREAGAWGAAGLALAGLVASFFHLGRPERAWRTASQWRTSWLSREVIVLPGFIALTLAYALAHDMAPEHTAWLGLLAAVAALALFLCTGMIYACMRFLREWATPLTPLNFALLGCANGFTLATAVSMVLAPALLHFFTLGAVVFTLAALTGRLAGWRRNSRLSSPSTLHSAIGVRQGRIEQIAQGFMGGSFNTREFFHGRSPAALRALRWMCLLAGFGLPLALLGIALHSGASPSLLGLAAILQYLGLLAERWLFFAEARHPQNLYYQRMA